jgi:uncharacterized protein YbaR (Trm112 family)
MLDLDLLKLLGNPLHPNRPALLLKGEYLVCSLTGVGYPIIDGIPQLLPEDVISVEKLKELLKND